jgi:hypothetical protein
MNSDNIESAYNTLLLKQDITLGMIIEIEEKNVAKAELDKRIKIQNKLYLERLVASQRHIQTALPLPFPKKKKRPRQKIREQIDLRSLEHVRLIPWLNKGRIERVFRDTICPAAHIPKLITIGEWEQQKAEVKQPVFPAEFEAVELQELPACAERVECPIVFPCERALSQDHPPNEIYHDFGLAGYHPGSLLGIEIQRVRQRHFKDATAFVFEKIPLKVSNPIPVATDVSETDCSSNWSISELQEEPPEINHSQKETKGIDCSLQCVCVSLLIILRR